MRHRDSKCQQMAESGFEPKTYQLNHDFLPWIFLPTSVTSARWRHSLSSGTFFAESSVRWGWIRWERVAQCWGRGVFQGIIRDTSATECKDPASLGNPKTQSLRTTCGTRDCVIPSDGKRRLASIQLLLERVRTDWSDIKRKNSGEKGVTPGRDFVNTPRWEKKQIWSEGWPLCERLHRSQ